MENDTGGVCLSQVEVPEWYVPGAVRAASPERPRVTAAVQAAQAAAQEVAAAFDITHGKESSWLLQAGLGVFTRCVNDVPLFMSLHSLQEHPLWFHHYGMVWPRYRNIDYRCSQM